jgi:hypothetical protein
MSALKSSPKNEVYTVTPPSDEDVKRVYWLCGGSIRNMLKACSVNFAEVENYLETIVDSLGIEAIECAVTSTVRRANSPDSIRWKTFRVSWYWTSPRGYGAGTVYGGQSCTRYLL